MKYFAKIDSLRFVAALMVLISHWLYYFPFVRALNLGEMGVDLFFTISGFLITLQLLNFKERAKANNLSKGAIFKEFFLRRAFRIFPLYYLIVIVSAVANEGEIREALPWNLAFLCNFYIIKIQHWPGLFSHFWSLSVEEHFYLFWPLLVVFTSNKWLPYVTLLLISCTFFIKIFVVGDNRGYFFLHLHTVSCIDLIMYGCLLAWIYKNHFHKLRDVFQFQGFALVSVGLIVCGVIYKYYFKFSLEDYVMLRSCTGIAFTFLVGSLVFSTISKKWSIFGNKWLVLGGKLSFGIYLIHNFIPGLMLGIKDLNLHWSLEFVSYLVVTILISAILHYGVELPLKRVGKRKFSSALLND